MMTEIEKVPIVLNSPIADYYVLRALRSPEREARAVSTLNLCAVSEPFYFCAVFYFSCLHVADTTVFIFALCHSCNHN